MRDCMLYQLSYIVFGTIIRKTMVGFEPTRFFKFEVTHTYGTHLLYFLRKQGKKQKRRCS